MMALPDGFVKKNQPPGESGGTGYYFIFSGSSMLMARHHSPDRWDIPVFDESAVNDYGLTDLRAIGIYNRFTCFCGRAETDNFPGYAEWMNLRSLYGKIDDGLWAVAGYARQISDWSAHFRYCGQCGELNREKADEHARICPSCGLVSYPRISPAIMAAVIREDEILLARGVAFPDKKMFSVLAGFVEPGESLENCVRREVFEEVGIRVGDIQYAGSQSWPFPDSLMIGFTARYHSGAIRPDPVEIVEAAWFKRENLPKTPQPFTLAGQLINRFCRP